MRDPIEDVKRELRAVGAVCIAGGKGSSKWKFPDGRSFTFERKSGSPRRDAMVALRRLRSMFAASPEMSSKLDAEIAEIAQIPGELSQEVLPEISPAPEIIETSPVTRERWAASMAQLEASKKLLEDELSTVSRRIEMLKSVESYLDEPTFVETLLTVMPKEKVPTTLAPAKPLSQYVRVEATRELVRTAIAMFDTDRDFQIMEVMDLLIAGHKIDEPERKRIRSSVTSSLYQLMERGEVQRTVQGVGKRPAFFRRVDLAERGASF